MLTNSGSIVLILSPAMQQPDPEAIENKQRGIKVNEEMRAAVEDILRGNTGIVLDLKAELYRRRKNHRWANPTSMCHGLFFTPKLEVAPLTGIARTPRMSGTATQFI